MIKCTCEQYGWPDLRRDNSRCPIHSHDCGCDADHVSKDLWCPFVHCPRKEKLVTTWKVFVPYEIPEVTVKILIEEMGGVYLGSQTYRTDIDKACFHFDGSWEITQILLSQDERFEVYSRR